MKKDETYRLERYMIRPMIVQMCTRAFYTTGIVLWIDFLCGQFGVPMPTKGCLLIAGLFFLMLTLTACMRRGGRDICSFDRNLFRRKKQAYIGVEEDLTAVADHEPKGFAALQEREQDLCLVYANAFVCVSAILASLFF